MLISYSPAEVAVYVSAVTVQTSETLIASFTDQSGMQKSQFSVYTDWTLGGGATSLKLRYYHSPDKGTNWYEVPIKNGTTGQLLDTGSVLQSGSPAKVVEDVGTSGSFAFKVTGQSTGGTSTINNLYVIARDN